MDVRSDIMVSIDCITYNHGKYIRRCLESLVSQKTNFRYEILVHDDASTDNTADIIREFEVKYPHLVKPVYQKENQFSQGVTVSYVYQFPRALGKYIAFCEGDDYWASEDKLQRQFDIMERYPQCCLCTHKVQHINESGEVFPETTPNDRICLSSGVVPHDVAAELILYRRKSWPFHTSSFFYRKDTLLRLATEQTEYKKFLNGDLCMLLNALTYGEIYYIEDVMSNYRRFALGSFTSMVRDQKTADKDRFLIKTAKGELLFDVYSEYKYHDIIMRGVCERLTACEGLDKGNINGTLAELGIKKKEMYSILWDSSKYCFLLFTIQLLSPKFRHFLSKQKKVLRRTLQKTRE